MYKPHPADLLEPVRNLWFTGKMLDAYHMDLETDYGNRKRWLLNRLVLGSGVVGLDVKPGPSPGADRGEGGPGHRLDGPRDHRAHA